MIPSRISYVTYFLFHLFLTCLQAQRAIGTNITVADFIPQLGGLQRNINAFHKVKPGEQDFDICCLLAVNESVRVDSAGNLVKTPNSFIVNDLPTFLHGQFPCGASYSQGDTGAPVVTIPYSFCRKNCSSWAVSSTRKLNQWVSPLAGFIVPAVVFCLAIPRRRKLYLFDDALFNVPLNKLTSTPSILVRSPVAALLVSIDTVLWLVIVFALAGPIMVSGIFEALLDRRVLEYLSEKVDNGRLTTRQRARILYTTLLGNLDMHSDRGHDDGAWNHMNKYLIPRLSHTGVEGTKTCLGAMLASQYSFGVTVGAPVVFFGASFVYTLVEIIGSYGNNDLSLALGKRSGLQAIDIRV